MAARFVEFGLYTEQLRAGLLKGGLRLHQLFVRRRLLRRQLRHVAARFVEFGLYTEQLRAGLLKGGLRLHQLFVRRRLLRRQLRHVAARLVEFGLYTEQRCLDDTQLSALAGQHVFLGVALKLDLFQACRKRPRLCLGFMLRQPRRFKLLNRFLNFQRQGALLASQPLHKGPGPRFCTLQIA